MATAPKMKAVYFNGYQSITLDVLDTNEDGTLELGIAGTGKKADVLKVGSCVVADEQKTGCCGKPFDPSAPPAPAATP